MGAVLNMAVASLLFVSVLGVIFAGHQLLLIRSVAVDAARFSALAESNSSESQRYALRLLTQSVPRLASYEIKVGGSQNFSEVSISTRAVGLGFLAKQIPITAKAKAKYEKFG